MGPLLAAGIGVAAEAVTGIGRKTIKAITGGKKKTTTKRKKATATKRKTTTTRRKKAAPAKRKSTAKKRTVSKKVGTKGKGKLKKGFKYAKGGRIVKAKGKK
jgi:hypothetical protein